MKNNELVNNKLVNNKLNVYSFSLMADTSIVLIRQFSLADKYTKYLILQLLSVTIIGFNLALGPAEAYFITGETQTQSI